MLDVLEMLRRQAEWQRSRRLLTWEEKVRMVLAVRPTLLRFQALRDATKEDRSEDKVKSERP